MVPGLTPRLKKQGTDDASTQPYSGRASRQSLEVYSWLAVSGGTEGPLTRS